MSGSIWAIVVIVGILASAYMTVSKNRMEQKGTESAKRMDELESEMEAMRKRIENLEAIAVAEQNPFNEKGSTSEESPEDQYREQNREELSTMANKLKSR